ncbi:uncharacterized protein LACBIDRAFT_323354 [Laccaria bicolor S238N-H82]|uniref:Predicted protein n=1 Tax=Laccaria bicolor (strain S238N-H82 / ATCC MYA-4686) TaxID=486041 RepID=B0CZY3_LACBS|nr:uncharacterized protein LACBIDRAFT_323354 [Laccaria bicolor S238N-H82]EDR12698.1 predicted protein [Laccaria bicolor S238N-H82]|eukprot:XP_001876962.1 predicted protein [Laccaria bicolor S238N-H82]
MFKCLMAKKKKNSKNISWLTFLLFPPYSTIISTIYHQLVALVAVVEKEQPKIVGLLEAVDGIRQAHMANEELKGSFTFHISLNTWRFPTSSCQYDTGFPDYVKRAWLQFCGSMAHQVQFMIPISGIMIGASAVLLTLTKTGDIIQFLALATIILFSALLSLVIYLVSYETLDDSIHCALILTKVFTKVSEPEDGSSMGLTFIMITLYHFKVVTNQHILQKVFLGILGGLAAICAILNLI